MADEEKVEKPKPPIPKPKFHLPSFGKKSKIKKDLKKIEKLTDEERKHEELKEQMFAVQHKKKKRKHTKVGTAKLLVKAGVPLTQQQYSKIIFRTALGIAGILTVLILISGSIYAKGALNILIFLAGFWTAGFAAIWILVYMLAAAYLDIRIQQRREELERVLPDFLQLTAANIGAGMTIDRALWYAVRPRFGVLAKEIESVAKHVLTGEELSSALHRFSQQYESPTVQRSVNLLLEGLAAGGKIADLLNKIAVDIQEQRILRQEMAANVMTYVIFIGFASIVAAPVLFGLSTELLVVIQGIASGVDVSSSSSTGFSVSADVIQLSDFTTFSVVVLICTSILSAMITSTIRNGNVLESLRLIPFYGAISVILYFLAVGFFRSIFGGLL